MVPQAPSDAVWDALAPLLGQLEAAQGLLDVCALYLPLCAGSAAGLAILMLTGLMLSEVYGGGGETVSVIFSDESVHPRLRATLNTRTRQHSPRQLSSQQLS